MSLPNPLNLTDKVNRSRTRSEILRLPRLNESSHLDCKLPILSWRYPLLSPDLARSSNRGPDGLILTQAGSEITPDIGVVTSQSLHQLDRCSIRPAGKKGLDFLHQRL